MQSFRKRMMFNINSDISDVPTTGKISVTTNNCFESKNGIRRATVGYLSVFVFDIDLFYLFIFFLVDHFCVGRANVLFSALLTSR